MADYNPMLDPEALLTTEQHAQLRGASANTIRRERRERRGVPFVAINHNTIRYRRQDILDFIAAHRVDVAASSHVLAGPNRQALAKDLKSTK